ncbi:hypothetical protein MUN74_19025 [Agromyces endophyticus]|uniref:hypothetical protein n=1 Tax=Agromyces sp. H17E-10 TaxID=2932244 RepID=UPI001FD480D4|nr:hypothetical protein [Agromyces sp. H17E-10]UOQ89319.1 hypothetical protein MUN74_19025 [Agromyces sp. H17E-10]
MSSDAPHSDAQERRAETRWPAFLGIVVAAVLVASVPQPGTATLRTIALVALTLMAVPLFVVNPHRLDRETQWSRALAIAFAFVLVGVNQVSVVGVIARLLDGSAEGAEVLLEAGQVWVTNIIAFGLLFWELDRGGPVSRGTLDRGKLPLADFSFPQDDQADAAPEVSAGSTRRADWRAGFVDYLYVSFTNTVAFSPTDAMPLRSRTKLLMAVQALTGFVLLALVISRAVNILS